MRASDTRTSVLRTPMLSLRCLITVVLAAAMALAATLATAAAHAGLRLQGTHKSADGRPQYYWPRARGDVGRYAVTPLMGPRSLQASLSWFWHHPEGKLHTIVVSGPLIDDKLNIYIATEDGVRKFSKDGTKLWFYQPHGRVSTCPSLHAGALYGNTQGGYVFAVDMETGKELWTFRKAQFVGGDTAYVEAYEGVVVTGVDPTPGGGATRLLGIDAFNGTTLWEVKFDQVLWNVMPVFPDDGSFIVMNIRGGLYKHALHSGKLLWSASPPKVSKNSFSDGGVMLGPDGTSYTCSNYKGGGQQGMHGALRAYALKDGTLLWDRYLEYPCNSWPAVTADGRSVVVPTGAFVAGPASSNDFLMSKFHKTPTEMHVFSLMLGAAELKVYGMSDKTAAIQAFDARTGVPLWTKELPPYGRLAARADDEGFLLRKKILVRDQCLPAQFGSPTISGDGTVWVGRADGLLYALDKFHHVHTFDAAAGFLHPGTSWAPGMMAVTSCDGLFVWKY